MTVYVDDYQGRFGRMIMCHMFADSLDELHTFAARLGLKREWFQTASAAHYDLCLSKRGEAVRLGAEEIFRVKQLPDRRSGGLFEGESIVAEALKRLEAWRRKSRQRWYEITSPWAHDPDCKFWGIEARHEDGSNYTASGKTLGAAVDDLLKQTSA